MRTAQLKTRPLVPLRLGLPVLVLLQSRHQRLFWNTHRGSLRPNLKLYVSLRSLVVVRSHLILERAVDNFFPR